MAEMWPTGAAMGVVVASSSSSLHDPTSAE
jgi:hypothetical protein